MGKKVASVKPEGRKQKPSEKKSPKATVTRGDTTARFPYTTKPSSLRKLLKEIPKKPKPHKYDKNLLKSWGFSDSNDLTMLRVLKAVELLNEKNEPTEAYSRFMHLDGGAKELGPYIRKVYAPLFQASHAPYDESNEKLQNLFNIHSGGSTIDHQIQTFKSLCDNASFDEIASPSPMNTQSLGGSAVISGTNKPNELTSQFASPMININLHIHLPENKSRRDYEDIIEDIGRYIFGRTNGGRSE